MDIAFSGSKGPLTKYHTARVISVLEDIPLSVRIITGGCVGIDALVAEIASELNFHVHTVLPGNHSRVDPYWRVNCKTYEQLPFDVPQPYRERNQRMVDLSDLLIAFPQFEEDHPRSKRSGTHMTIRMGRRKRNNDPSYRIYVRVLEPSLGQLTEPEGSWDDTKNAIKRLNRQFLELNAPILSHPESDATGSYTSDH